MDCHTLRIKPCKAILSLTSHRLVTYRIFDIVSLTVLGDIRSSSIKYDSKS
ncbi:hypothetical protein [Ferroplasma acidiphilum]|uniref:hypothetical protein n=1 Tax=Ferroplasma acidiphilum TaxID=74969 RepID=UPI0028160E6C|nr:hypothetical protein [Ferroplasma acidiphilum]WMT53539.1 MAG: hypothetical protein RE473_01500 [Ferroplasma acidiphilum]